MTERTPITIDCAVCGISFSRAPTITGRKPKYCSRQCVDEALRQQKHSMKNLSKRCVVCDAEFFTDKWKINTRKYCSQKCQSINHLNNGPKIEVPCATCGVLIIRSTHDVTKSKRNYCGYKCMAKGKTLLAPRTNKWANVRRWFSRFGRMSECQHCGYKEMPGILVLHHKDRDRSNNALDNLVVLCPNCHAVEHLNENKTGWQHHSKDPRKIELRNRSAEKRLQP